jgi:hypothetical protein
MSASPGEDVPRAAPVFLRAPGRHPPVWRPKRKADVAVHTDQVQVISAPCPISGQKTRRQARKLAQALADVPEGKARLRPLHQFKDVAFGVAHRIPPAAASMADNQNLTLAATVLQAELRALLSIRPNRVARGGRRVPAGIEATKIDENLGLDRLHEQPVGEPRQKGPVFGHEDVGPLRTGPSARGGASDRFPCRRGTGAAEEGPRCSRSRDVSNGSPTSTKRSTVKDSRAGIFGLIPLH